ncbi:MAG: ABC-F family ATP-binding cassette domain-containing protein [Phycisphaerales bacterium]|nr:ABC-F family ATP-binding cassette domain-containing protein [Phycisphaerales bacterium]
MPPLIVAQSIAKRFAGRTLFAGVSVSVEDGERLALIGPNGAGKSTLLKIFAGQEAIDEGELSFRRGLRAAYIAQTDAFPAGATARDALIASLLEPNAAPHLHDAHEVELEADLALDLAGLADRAESPCESLSGGQRKRLSIARALARKPDLLLLDEPTNHLDIEGVDWLESTLARAESGVVIVTHDRAFLERGAERIVELAQAYPDGCFSVRGGYDEFLRRKNEFLEAQQRQMQALSMQVREDLRWLSRGAKARRTKSKSRIHASYERMDELAELRSRNAPEQAAQIDFSATERQTQKLLVGRGLSKSFDGRTLFANLDVALSPGLILGLIGPNGAGKSTLIRLITGEEQSDPPTEAMLKEEASRARLLPHGAPALGTIRRAEKLRIVHFSQRRTELDPNLTLGETLAPDDAVIYRGQSLHVATWAQMFLFGKDRLRTPIKALSGGEQARVHIARLMLEPADILILDEPTNDLDLASLEVLEESLEDFPGAVLLVTHDRAMLDRLANRVLALDGKGGARYFADYQQWKDVAGIEAEAAAKAARAAQRPKSALREATAPAPARTRLSYKEQRELDGMERAIEEAEAAATAAERDLSDPGTLADHRRMAEASRRLADAQAHAASLYARWEALEARRAGG